MELTKRAASAVWWSAMEISSRYVVQFGVTVVLARLLVPADFGLIAMLLVFTSVGSMLVDSGFGAALIQRRNTTENDETTVFIFSSCSGAIAGLALWLAAPAIASFYRQPDLVGLTHLIAWTLPMGGLAAVPDALLTKRLKFERRTRSEIIASMVSATLAVLLAWQGYGVWSMAWQSVSAAAMRTACLWGFARWLPRGRFQKESLKQLFGFGAFLLLARLSDTIFMRVQGLLLGRLFSASTLGYYSLAQNAQQAPTNIISTILNRVGLPVFAEVADRPEKLKGGLQLTMRVSLFLFFPCMVGLAFLSKPVIVLVYGPRWEPAAPVLAILALASSIYPLHILNLAVLTAQGRSGLLLKLEIIKKVVSLTLVVVASWFGPIAVAAAVLAGSLFATVVNTHYSKKMLEYGLTAQLMDQRPTLALCTIAGLSGWTVAHFCAPSMLCTVAAVAIAAISYIGAALLFRCKAMEEFVAIAKAILEKSKRKSV